MTARAARTRGPAGACAGWNSGSPRTTWTSSPWTTDRICSTRWPPTVRTWQAVSKHINNVFIKLDLYPAEEGNRRVLAVLTYLNA